MIISIVQNYTQINCSLKDMSLFPQSAMNYLTILIFLLWLTPTNKIYNLYYTCKYAF